MNYWRGMILFSWLCLVLSILWLWLVDDTAWGAPLVYGFLILIFQTRYNYIKSFPDHNPEYKKGEGK